MKRNKLEKFKSEITGHLDILIEQKEDELDGKVTKWEEVLIHGDPEGLKSFAKLLIKIAELNQDENINLPIGEREHIHLRPNLELSASSVEVILGRIDAKGTGVFYKGYIPKINP